MSSIYATEPITSGRVILETTHGPLDILLWCRECPATTKLFLQLCMDGYYDNMLFHRIVPNLLIQSGAMRGGDGGGVGDDTTNDPSRDDNMDQYREAVEADTALERRKYEVNSRIRFNHRGQVAMALGVDDEENGDSGDKKDLQFQFFITTEDAPYLDGKHVIFGTLGAGPTIFNAIRICKFEVDEQTNQPVDLEHAPRIVSCKIVENSIHDTIAPRLKVPWRVVEEANKAVGKRKKKTRKGKLDVNVLSFGDEMGDVDFLKSNVKEQQDANSKQGTDAQAQTTTKGGDNSSQEAQVPASDTPAVASQSDKNQESYTVPVAANTSGVSSRGNDVSEAIPDGKPEKQKGNGGKREKKHVSLVEARRAKYAKGRKSKQEREDDTLSRLMAFQGKLSGVAAGDASKSNQRNEDNSLAARMARRAERENEEGAKAADEGVTYHGQVLESDGEDGNDSKWMQTKFKCRRHIDHQASDRRNGIDEYDVVDDKRKRKERGDDEHRHHHKKRHHRKHKNHDRRGSSEQRKR